MNILCVLHSIALLLVSSCQASTIESRFTSPSDPRRFHYITLPSKGAGPCDITTGADGETIWFRDLKANVIGVYDVLTKKVKEYALDSPAPAENSTLYRCWVRTGSDGNIYSGAPGLSTFIRVTPKNSAVKVYYDAVTDPYEASSSDTHLYVTNFDSNTLTSYDYKTQRFETVSLTPPNSGPTGANAMIPDTLYYSQADSQQITSMDESTGQTSHYDLPLPTFPFPGLMRAYTEDKYLWVIALSGIELARIDTAMKPVSIKVFNSGPSNGTYYQNEADPLNRVWLTDPSADLLIYYTPSKGTFTTIVPPNSSSGAGADKALPIHYGPLNSMWFTNLATGQLGYYELS